MVRLPAQALLQQGLPAAGLPGAQSRVQEGAGRCLARLGTFWASLALACKAVDLVRTPLPRCARPVAVFSVGLETVGMGVVLRNSLSACKCLARMQMLEAMCHELAKNSKD